jgi:hypothetical protein
MTRQLRVAVLSGLFLLSILAMGRCTPAQTPSNQPHPKWVPPTATDQMTNIPYFTLQDGMSSVLTLNNNAPTSIPVTVTIFNMKGKAQMLEPIIVDAHSFKQIDLSDKVVSDEFNEGNIEVAFKGIPMEVGCQVSISNVSKRVSFESREQDMMDFNSTKLNGIVSLPTSESKGFLALTNTSSNEVAAHVSIGSKTESVKLNSRETHLLRLSQDFDLRWPAAAIVKLQQDGMPGDIITTAFVVDLNEGYSSSFAMVDPALMRSSHLAGVHFRIGEPDPSEGFPEGTRFHSPLLLANVSDSPVSARVSVDYTVKGNVEKSPRNTRVKEFHGDGVEGASEKADSAATDKFGTEAVENLTIPAGSVARIDLAETLENLALEGRITEAGVDIDYDAPPGAITGNLVSVDESGDYSFEVPIKDPSEPGQMTNSAYPWTIENGTNTVLHLKNTTENSVLALLDLAFPGGGIYQPQPITLKPHQSIAIDIQELKKSGKRDLVGRTFPTDGVRGQIYWVQRTAYSMIGRAEETNTKSGTASSFSCNLCCDNYNFEDFFLTPASAAGIPGASTFFTASEEYTNCTGMYFPNAAPQQPGTWSTSNSSVVTVNPGSYSAVSTFVGGGQADVEGTFPYKEYDWNGYSCPQASPQPTYTAVAPVNVTVPTRDRIVSTISQFVPTNCPAGQSGYFRKVLKRVVDNNGFDIIVSGQAMSETVTASTPNDFGFSNFNIGDGITDSSGDFTDTFSFCNAKCPSPGGTSVVNQIPHDKPSGATTTYDLTQNTLSYMCNSITVNGL